MEFKDYYEALGVEPGAGEAEIKTAYRRLARKYHPDVSKEKGAEERFKAINEAYEVLRDKDKRAPYDQLSARGYRPGEEFRPPPDFGGFGAGRQWFRRRPGGFRFEQAGSAAAASATSSNRCSAAARARRRRGRGAPARRRATRARSWRCRWRSPTPAASSRIGVDGRTLEVKIPAGIRPGPGDPPRRRRGRRTARPARATCCSRSTTGRTASSRWTAATSSTRCALAPWEAALGATVSVPTLGGRGGPARAAGLRHRPQAAPARPRPAGQAGGGRPDRRDSKCARRSRRPTSRRELYARWPSVRGRTPR